MTLNLDRLTDNLTEIISLAIQGKKPACLATDFSETLLYQSSRGWGLFYRGLFWAKEGLLLEDHTDRPVRRAIQKTERALEEVLARVPGELESYYQHTDLLIRRARSAFDPDFLIRFSNTFKPICKALRGPHQEKISGLFSQIFVGANRSIDPLLEVASALRDQQACMEFELMTRLPIPWRALTFILVSRFKFPDNIHPDLKQWVENIYVPPEGDWVSPSRKREWRDFILKKLSKLLPVLWEQVKKIERVDSERISYSHWIECIKAAGFEDAFLAPVSKIALSTSQAGFRVVESPSLSHFHVQISLAARYPEIVPFRQILEIDRYGRGAVIEWLEDIDVNDEVSRRGLVVLLFRLADRNLIPVRCTDHLFDPSSFGYNHQGELKAKIPLRPQVFQPGRF